MLSSSISSPSLRASAGKPSWSQHVHVRHPACRCHPACNNCAGWLHQAGSISHSRLAERSCLLGAQHARWDTTSRMAVWFCLAVRSNRQPCACLHGGIHADCASQHDQPAAVVTGSLPPSVAAHAAAGHSRSSAVHLPPLAAAAQQVLIMQLVAHHVTNCRTLLLAEPLTQRWLAASWGVLRIPPCWPTRWPRW